MSETDIEANNGSNTETSMSELANKIRHLRQEMNSVREKQEAAKKTVVTDASTIIMKFKEGIEKNEKITEYIKSVSIDILKPKLAVVFDTNDDPDGETTDEQKIAQVVRMLVKDSAKSAGLQEDVFTVVTGICVQYEADIEKLIGELGSSVGIDILNEDSEIAVMLKQEGLQLVA